MFFSKKKLIICSDSANGRMAPAESHHVTWDCIPISPVIISVLQCRCNKVNALALNLVQHIRALKCPVRD